MSGGKGGMSKTTIWKGYPKIRCKKEGCKKRVRSDPELNRCNKHSNIR